MQLHAPQHHPHGARLRRGVTLAAVLIVLAACSDEPTSVRAPSATPPGPALAKGGKPVPGIAYSVGLVDTDASIFVINPDGTGLTRITDAPEDQEPAWSPDYRKLAIARGIGSGSKIVVLSVNGARETVLGPGISPAWSPDGSRIAFTTSAEGNSDVYVMNEDGTGVLRLTTDAAHDYTPHWSPDGQRIAFVSLRTGTPQVWVMNADGSGQAQVTSCASGYQCRTPKWSPVVGDNRILYSHYWTSGNAPYSAIETIAPDGTGLTVVFSDPTLTGSAAWSPDAQRIAFVARLHGQTRFDIYAMKANGTEISRVTVNTAGDHSRSPAWAR